MWIWPFKPRRIGLVLGGGVSHGVAHIGVLKVIERYKIPIDYIAATSSGAIVGALYAAGLEMHLIEELALHLHWRNLVKISILQKGMLTTRGVHDRLVEYLGDKEFKDLKTPFAVAATCLKQAEVCILDKGKVADAVAGSSAFPGFFLPLEIGQHLLVDGGVTGYQVPVDTAKKMGAKFIIASDVVPIFPVSHLPLDPIHVFERSANILMHKLALSQIYRADILIQPQISEEDLWHLDESKARRLISAGEGVALQALKKLRRD
ncbi:MAG: patatin-like phospholipase family protein [Candidatus Margulisiibacteriota bacterium]|nr:patatin-like phospholipase family protein [Candidatus Margulisiibacteriota bacterium]